MDQKATTGTDIITIVAEPGALVFATRKEWRELPEICLDELKQHKTVLVFYGAKSVLFLLENMNPIEYRDPGAAFRLVKITNNEEGKQIFYIMLLSRAEAEQLILNRLTLWE